MKYTCQAEIEINQPPNNVFSWLFVPQQMKTWIVNVDEIKWITEGEIRLGSCFQISSYLSRQAAEYIGEITVFNQSSRIEKKYNLGGIKAGGWLPIAVNETETENETEYERLVGYVLTPTRVGTHLICATTTNIPGMASNVAKICQKAEQKHLVQSLKRLTEVATHGKFSFMKQLWFSLIVNGNYTFSPL